MEAVLSSSGCGGDELGRRNPMHVDDCGGYVSSMSTHLLRHPPPTALARPADAIPAENAMRGGSRYEPKYDGVRALVARDAGTVRIWSRRGTDLTGAFPELVLACTQLPDASLFDGEIVALVDGKLDFDVLLSRLNAGRRRAASLASAHPVHLVLFDVLVLADDDLRADTYDARRSRLEQVAVSWRPPLQLTPMTVDVATAREWFDELVVTGIEGLVVKGGAQPYSGGERLWTKVKHHETQDVILGAVIGPLSAPRQIVVGTMVDGVLRIAGRSAPLSSAASRQLASLLHPPAGEHPWPAVIGPGVLDRFSSTREPVSLTLVEPVIAEISADTARTRGSFRHAFRFLRLRSDLAPAVE